MEWNTTNEEMQCIAQWNGLKYTMAWNAMHNVMECNVMQLTALKNCCKMSQGARQKQAGFNSVNISSYFILVDFS